MRKVSDIYFENLLARKNLGGESPKTLDGYHVGEIMKPGTEGSGEILKKDEKYDDGRVKDVVSFFKGFLAWSDPQLSKYDDYDFFLRLEIFVYVMSFGLFESHWHRRNMLNWVLAGAKHAELLDYVSKIVDADSLEKEMIEKRMVELKDQS